MRMLEIPDLYYDKFRGILDDILETIPFALLNSEYSAKHKKGYFYFWDEGYIPPALLEFAKRPPETHENVKKLHAKLEKTVNG